MHDFFGIPAVFARIGLFLLAGLLFCAPSSPAAAGPRIAIDIGTGACIFSAPKDIGLAGAKAEAARGNCPGSLSTGAMRDSWLVKSGLDLTQHPAEPLSIHLKQTLFEDITLYVRYADGSVWTTRHDAASAGRHTELGGMFRLRIPWRAGAIETIALHAGNVVDPRGAFVRPTIENTHAETIETERQSLIYGLFGGVILTTLFFNFVLLVWLRYAFLFFYCGMTAATLLYGIAASGILMRSLPAGLPPMLGNVAAEAVLPVMLWFAAVFTITLLERGTVHVRLAIASVALATLQVGAGVIALITLFRAPELLHIPLAAVNILGAITMALIFPIAIIAWRRGSRIILIYTVAWAVPLAGAFARILVALGFIETSAFIEDSYFYAMCLECVLSMIGIAYRISNIRAERDEARAREIELTYLAETDALTGLLNRRAFVEYGVRMSGKGTLKSRLLLIDIDHFKTVNDGFGHEFGDRVLREAGRLLESIAPADAVVGRLGGEEFALIVPYSERDDTAGTILRAFRSTPMTEGIRITVSIGSVTAIIADDRSWRHAYRRADEMLYEAKRTGRDRHVAVAEPGSSVASAA
ncbi:sensor domain-containing diguanylate cyclase [Sphingosinicella soli]|uniref:diguanylate cyclase n=1 Tax=Sphingosinicella soli TaxID=333708 RepID=A0A7W7B2G3_9SPHN|nr:diguanylate cyclase [Sphingosinicella soli]MBB4632624.1 diguanylate cyclase (GGDEF)-like protein [Sphingosinicella soli]